MFGPNPPHKTPFLAHFVTKRGPFGPNPPHKTPFWAHFVAKSPGKKWTFWQIWGGASPLATGLFPVEFSKLINRASNLIRPIKKYFFSISYSPASSFNHFDFRFFKQSYIKLFVKTFLLGCYFLLVVLYELFCDYHRETGAFHSLLKK